MLTLGANVKKIREIRGYTQDFMAKKLRISQEQYSYLETKQKSIPEDYIKIIATLLDVSIDFLKSFNPDNIVQNDFDASRNEHLSIYSVIIKSHESEIEAYKELIGRLKEEIIELKQRVK